MITVFSWMALFGEFREIALTVLPAQFLPCQLGDLAVKIRVLLAQLDGRRFRFFFSRHARRISD